MISKFFQILGLPQFFHTVGQNNFGNKIPMRTSPISVKILDFKKKLSVPTRSSSDDSTAQ